MSVAGVLTQRLVLSVEPNCLEVYEIKLVDDTGMDLAEGCTLQYNTELKFAAV
jgi:hypothetical protein